MAGASGAGGSGSGSGLRLRSWRRRRWRRRCWRRRRIVVPATREHETGAQGHGKKEKCTGTPRAGENALWRRENGGWRGFPFVRDSFVSMGLGRLPSGIGFSCPAVCWRCCGRFADSFWRASLWGVAPRWGPPSSGWGCPVRGAEHRACRSEDRRSKPGCCLRFLGVAPRWGPAWPGGVVPCAARSAARAGLEAPPGELASVPSRCVTCAVERCVEVGAGFWGVGLCRAQLGALRVPVWRPPPGELAGVPGRRVRLCCGGLRGRWGLGVLGGGGCDVGGGGRCGVPGETGGARWGRCRGVQGRTPGPVGPGVPV